MGTTATYRIVKKGSTQFDVLRGGRVVGTFTTRKAAESFVARQQKGSTKS